VAYAAAVYPVLKHKPMNVDELAKCTPFQQYKTAQLLSTIDPEWQSEDGTLILKQSELDILPIGEDAPLFQPRRRVDLLASNAMMNLADYLSFPAKVQQFLQPFLNDASVEAIQALQQSKSR
jgi:hypothetical protein